MRLSGLLIANLARTKLACASSQYCYYYCITARAPLPVAAGKRPSPKELAAQRRSRTKEFWLPEFLSGTQDVESWPQELQHMVYRLDSDDRISGGAGTIASNLERFYPQDELLLRFAEFLKQGVKDGASFSEKLKSDSFCRDVAGEHLN